MHEQLSEDGVVSTLDSRHEKDADGLHRFAAERTAANARREVITHVAVAVKQPSVTRFDVGLRLL